MPNACKLANSAGTEKHENTYFSHCQTQSHKLKDRLSQQTDGQTNKSSHRVACPRLKKRMTNQLNGLTNRDSQKTNEQTDQQTSIHSNMYPTNRPTNQPSYQPTNGHCQFKTCFIAFKRRRENTSEKKISKWRIASFSLSREQTFMQELFEICLHVFSEKGRKKPQLEKMTRGEGEC